MATNASRPAGLPSQLHGRGGTPVIAPDSDLHLRNLIDVLRRGKGLIVLCTLAGLVLGSLAILLMPRRYEASSLIALDTTAGGPLGLQDLSGYGAEQNRGEQMNSDLLTAMTVIGSDTTMLAVIERLHLEETEPFQLRPGPLNRDEVQREHDVPLEQAPLHREQALKQFKDHLTVDGVRGTRLIAVTYRDSDPVRAANIANALVDASIEAGTGTRFQASMRASRSLTEQLARLKQSVDESQARADAFQKQTGVSGLAVVSPASNAAGLPSVTFNNLPLQRLLELNRDLTNAGVVRTEKEAIHHMTQTQDPAVVLGIGNTSIASGSVLAQGSSDLVFLQDLRSKQAAVETRLAITSSKYGAKNPAVVEQQAQLSSLKEQTGLELRRIQERSLNDLQLAMRTEEGIRRQVAEQQAEVAKHGDAAARLVVLQQQAQAERTLYQTLHSKLEEANVAAGVRGSNISVVDVARSAMTPSFPDPVRCVAFGLVGGFVVGMVLAFVLSYASDRIHDGGELAGAIHAPVLGSIPDFRDGRSRSASAWKPWREDVVRSKQPDAVITSTSNSPAAEAYRSFRTGLLQSGVTPSRTLLFLSGTAGEGRTTTCFNTAAAFAARGYRVLVVDADLRKPQASRYGIPADAPGLSSCLTGSVAPQDVVHALPGVENLSVLPPGPQVANTVELLGDTAFGELLKELLTRFDYVFLDSPPALTTADARVLAQHVDGFVLVVRANHTTSSELRSLSDWMGTASLSPLGVCLNATAA